MRLGDFHQDDIASSRGGDIPVATTQTKEHKP